MDITDIINTLIGEQSVYTGTHGRMVEIMDADPDFEFKRDMDIIRIMAGVE